MSEQQSLFSAENLASTVQIPAAPTLVPHYVWPYPGMTPINSAQSSMSGSQQYHEMLAAVIKAKGGARLTTTEVLSLVPQDWRDLCGPYAHGNIANWCAQDHNIEIIRVAHDGGGGHFEYKAEGGAA